MSESTGQKQKLMNSREAAELLGVRPDTLSVWRCTKAVQIPYIKVGKLVKYRPQDLEAYLEQQRRGC